MGKQDVNQITAWAVKCQLTIACVWTTDNSQLSNTACVTLDVEILDVPRKATPTDSNVIKLNVSCKMTGTNIGSIQPNY